MDGKFTEFPQFLIEDYLKEFYEKNLYSTITYDTSADLWEDGLEFIRIENPYLNFRTGTGTSPTGFLDFDVVYEKDEFRLDGGVLLGMNSAICTTGGRWLNLHAKIADYGFKPVKMRPILASTAHSGITFEDNDLTYFSMQKKDYEKLLPGSTITETITGNNVEFNTYDYSLQTESVKLSANDELYFRNDSFFHDWIEKNKFPEDDVFINTIKQFILFGRTWPTSYGTLSTSANMLPDKWHIEHLGMKDFAYAALPENNRSDTLKEFFKIYFDQVYEQTYNMIREISTLSDPEEIHMNWLGYIAKQYSVDLDPYSDLEEIRQREFVKHIIYWLKEKGTYSALFALWRILTAGTKNNLKVYECWHTAGLSGCPWNYFEDQLYTNTYSTSAISGNNYPAYYPDTYYTYSPSTSASETSASYFIGKTEILKDCYVHVQKENTSNLTITHPLDTKNIIIQCFDDDLNYFYPNTIQSITNDIIEISFATDFIGVILIAKTDKSILNDNNITWVLQHNLNKEDIIHQSTDLYRNVDNIPIEQELIDDNNSIMTFNENNTGYGLLLKADYTHTQETSSSVWNINHNLNYQSIVEVYDENNKKIIPESITLFDKQTCNIKFNYPINGKALFKRVGNPEYDYNNRSVLTLPPTAEGKILSTTYKIKCILNNEPFGLDYIINKSLISSLYYGWELLRPVSRVAHYYETITLLSDFSGNEVGMYPTNQSPTWKTGFFGNTEVLENCHITIQNNSVQSLSINHTLETKNILIQCYNYSLNRTIPKSIQITSNRTVQIEFLEDFTGMILVSKADTIIDQQSIKSIKWILQHNLQNINTLQQVSDENNNILMPKEIQNVDANSSEITFFEESTGYTTFNKAEYVYEQTTPSKIWQIEHNLEYQGCIVEVYDENNINIIPKYILLEDKNNTEIHFNTNITGKALFKKIGNPAFKSIIIDELDTTLSYWKIGNGGLSAYNPKILNDIQNETLSGYDININRYDDYYDITILIEKENEYSITELGLFNEKDEILFYGYGPQIYKINDVFTEIKLRIYKNQIDFSTNINYYDFD